MSLALFSFFLTGVLSVLSFKFGMLYVTNYSNWSKWHDVGVKYHAAKYEVYMLQTRTHTSGKRQFRKITIDSGIHPEQFVKDNYKTL